MPDTPPPMTPEDAGDFDDFEEFERFDESADEVGDVRAAVAEGLERVNDRVAAACDRAGRRPTGVTVVAVTKYAAPEQVRALISLGHRDLGENYVQNLQQRAVQFGEFRDRLSDGGDPNVAESLRWHLVGHLQRNKVKAVLPHLAMLQTVDSLRLAEEIDGQAPKVLGPNGRLAVLLQVNCSEEDQKSGVAVGAARHLGEQIATMPGLRLMGLMTMAKEGAGEDQARRTFARCREIFEEMQTLGIAGDDLRHLSMGMSADLEAGILEGATIVRVGSALFGSDEQPPSA